MTIQELREYIVKKTNERDEWLSTYKNLKSIHILTDKQLVNAEIIINSKIAQCNINIRNHTLELGYCLKNTTPT